LIELFGIVGKQVEILSCDAVQKEMGVVQLFSHDLLRCGLCGSLGLAPPSANKRQCEYRDQEGPGFHAPTLACHSVFVLPPFGACSSHFASDTIQMEPRS
jgi:hypothetical protein